MAEPYLNRTGMPKSVFQALREFVVQPDDQPGIPREALVLGVAGVLPFTKGRSVTSVTVSQPT